MILHPVKRRQIYLIYSIDQIYNTIPVKLFWDGDSYQVNDEFSYITPL